MTTVIHEQKIEKTKKDNSKTSIKLNKNSIIISAAIAIFFVLFLWNFWTKGTHILGFNMTIFLSGIFLLFIHDIKNIKDFLKKNYFWIVPLLGIIISFSLYENPFLKSINIYLAPICFLFFCSYASLSSGQNQKWSLDFLGRVAARKISLYKGRAYIRDNANTGTKTSIVIKKVLIGTSILVGINIIIISLLVAADDNFADLMSNFTEIITLSNLIKIFIAAILFNIFIATKIAWKEDYNIETIKAPKQHDPIVSGIVIGGTLFVYLLFIIVQIDTLITGSLPQNSNEVANLVKNGFWQLFFVSMINVVFYLIYFKRTNAIVQSILRAFVIASFIILLSAGEKMLLYVYDYGFSYEKFFALYTVIFFGVLFILMLAFSFSKRYLDIFKTSIFLAFWMYSFLCIFPTEKLIFKVNLHISERADSKIQKYQSHMLSSDIMGSVKNIKGHSAFHQQDWQAWIEKTNDEISDKKWYEKNISNF